MCDNALIVEIITADDVVGAQFAIMRGEPYRRGMPWRRTSRKASR
jgi:hypothetical protein